MVRPYETVYIFDSQLAEERVTEKLGKYHELLTGTEGGEITATDHWGRRQMAYPIAKRAAGYYVVTQFLSDSSALPEYERLLKLDDELLRYLVVSHEGEPTAQLSIQTRADRKDDDDGEDEEDDD